MVGSGEAGWSARVCPMARWGSVGPVAASARSLGAVAAGVIVVKTGAVVAEVRMVVASARMVRVAARMRAGGARGRLASGVAGVAAREVPALRLLRVGAAVGAASVVLITIVVHIGLRRGEVTITRIVVSVGA